MSLRSCLVVLFLAGWSRLMPVQDAQAGTVTGELEMVFPDALPGDRVGTAFAGLGDLDGDGTPDLAIGLPGRRLQTLLPEGAVLVCLMNPDGTVRSSQTTVTPTPGTDGEFGLSLARLGDLDGDGVTELAVGNTFARVHVLFLAADGSTRVMQEISTGTGGFSGLGSVEFGASVAGPGDLDGDGTADLIVGDPLGEGAAWILFLRPDGTVRQERKIARGLNGFGAPSPTSRLGTSVARLDDLDGDGIPELAVSTENAFVGSVWILFLRADGTVRTQQEIAPGTGGFDGLLEPGDRFGSSLTSAGDLDHDGTIELAVGAKGDDDGGVVQGALWILFLRSDGTVRFERKISAITGGFGGDLDPHDAFGSSVTALGDLDLDGTPELIAGAPGAGAAWLLFLRTSLPAPDYDVLPVEPGRRVGGGGPRLIVVDPVGAPCTRFQDVQAAVDASEDGDFVLVKGGFAGPVTIDDKSLFLVADPAASATLTIRGLAPQRRVVVHGLGGVLNVEDCMGPVWIEDCDMLATSIRGSSQVGLFHSTFEGTNHFTGFCQDGGTAVEIVDSTVFAYDSTFRGSEGCNGLINGAECGTVGCQIEFPGDGATAMTLENSLAYLFHSTLEAGAGGTVPDYTGPCGSCPMSVPGGTNGAALLLPGDSELVSADSTFTGSIVGTGPREFLSGAICDYAADGPLPPGSPVTLDFSGPMGNAVFVTYADAFAPSFLPERNGYSVVDPGAPTIPLGSLDGTGGLQVQLTLDLIEGRNRAAALFTQAKMYDPGTGAATLGAPSAFLVLRDPCR